MDGPLEIQPPKEDIVGLEPENMELHIMSCSWECNTYNNSITTTRILTNQLVKMKLQGTRV